MVDVRVLSEEESHSLTPVGVVLEGKERRYVHSISTFQTPPTVTKSLFDRYNRETSKLRGLY